MEITKNTGVLLGQKFTDWVSGKVSGVKYEVVNSSGDWRPYVPTGEKQYYDTFDTLNCTSYSNNNAAEIQLKYYTGYEFNFSDRALGELAGNTTQGNYLYKPADASRQYGRILEQDWPDDAGGDNWNSYYQGVPLNVLDKALFFQESYEWVGTDRTTLRYHLKQAPIQIVIGTSTLLHAVVLLKADSFGLYYFDSYSPWIKKTTQVPVSALKLITKPMSNVTFVHKSGTQEYGFFFPKLSPDALRDMAMNIGKNEIVKGDGTIDFAQAHEMTIN